MNESIEILPWCEKYFTGIQKIDEQHKRLVHLVNLLGSNITNQADTYFLDYIFTELTEYSIYHFQTEEGVWHQFLAGDPWESEHEMEHSNFVSMIIRLEKEEKSKPLDEVIRSALSFLVGWLEHHILESDKRMAKVVLAVQSGLSLKQAKQKVCKELCPTK